VPTCAGDSLLFAAGALAALGSLDVWLVSAVFIVAAILGDAVNYSIGNYLGGLLRSITYNSLHLVPPACML
jgi:membrane-associated protein